MGATEATNTEYQNSWAFETKQIHAGWDRDPQTGATSIPILQTTSFAFDSAERAAARFALQELGPIYTRLGNPTNDYVEARIAALEGGVGALLTSSGQSAITLAILNLASAGNNIVASPSLYGGSTSLLNNTLRRLGIDTRFVHDPYDVDEWLSLADENTVAFYGETIPNPKGDIFDIEKIAQAAHSVGVPLIVDNTVATPYLTRPIEWGADIVVHSATKYLGGHGTAISGAIVDAGNFDYTKDPKRFPGFNEPESSYAGLVFGHDLSAEKLGANLSYIIRARAIGLRDVGCAPSPFNSFLIEQGIQTLSLRVERHVDNALKVAKFLGPTRKSSPSTTRASSPRPTTSSTRSTTLAVPVASSPSSSRVASKPEPHLRPRSSFSRRLQISEMRSPWLFTPHPPLTLSSMRNSCALRELNPEPFACLLVLRTSTTSLPI